MSDKRPRGRPPGSPNKKPKLDDGLSPVERTIMKNADKIAGSLIDAAVVREDTRAAIYLIDRVLGKPKERVDVSGTTEQRIIVEYPDDWRKA